MSLRAYPGQKLQDKTSTSRCHSVCRMYLATPCAGLPTWLGKAAGAAASKAGYDGAFLAQTHPFRFLEMLADMPPIEQKVSEFAEGVSVEILTAAVCCSLSCCH